MKIFFDLDGTLIDSRQRLYRLFQYLVPASALSFDEYWDLKRNKIGHKEILLTQFNYTTAAFADFEQDWMKKIEQEEWLSFDQPFKDVTAYLIALKLKHRLFLVTARQSEEVAKKQIQQYGWQQIFEKIFVTAQKKEKHELIGQTLQVTHEDWMIGDTGKDIQTGKLLGMKTAAVLSGFLNKEKLQEYQPDVIVENVINLDFKHNENI